MTTTRVHHPVSAAEVVDLLARDPGECALVAGGTAFTILWRAGLIRASQLISCDAVRGLDAITEHDGQLRIGALATFRDVETSALVGRRLPVLAKALAHVANLRVRNVATWGGNLAEADNSSDLPAILTALDAEVVVRAGTGTRTTTVRDLITDFFTTTLTDEEMIVQLRVPLPPPGSGGSYVKFVSRSAEDRTCLGVAAFADLAEDGTCRDVRLSVIGAGPVPLRMPEAEAELRGTRLDEATARDLAQRYAAAADPLSDLRGSAEYRRKVLPGLAVRALTRAAARCDDAVLA